MIVRSPLLGLALLGVAAGLLLLLRCVARRFGVTLRARTWAILLGLALLAAGPRLLDGHYLLPPLDAGAVPGLPGRGEPPGPYGVLNDVQLQLLPWEIEVRRNVADGAAPFWSHLVGGGNCLWCNPQAQVAAPIAWLARPFPALDFFLIALVLKVLTAAAGATALAKLLGLREPYALWTGATFALCGGIFAWALFPLSSTLAYVPWVVAAAIRIARHRDRSSLVAGALLVALLWASGHPETAVAGLLLAAIAAFALVRRSRPLAPAALRLAAFVLAGTLLAAPLLLPFAHAALDSIRFVDMRHLQESAPERSTHWLLRWFSGGDLAFALGPLGPDVYGRPYRDPFDGPYNWPTALGLFCGLQALAGLLIAAGPGRRRAMPFALHALASLLVAVRFLPFDQLRTALPLVGTMAPERLLPVACLSLSVAAAFGWQRVGRGRLRWPAAGMAALALCGAVALAPTGRTIAEAAIAATALLLLARRAASARWLFAAQAVLLASWGWSLLPSAPAARVATRTPELRKVQETVAALPFSAVVGYDFELYPNLLPTFGIRDVRANDPLARAELRDLLHVGLGFSPGLSDYFSPVRLLRPRFLERLGVCCVVTHRLHPVELAAARTVELGDDRRLLVVHDAIEPVSSVRTLRGHRDAGAILHWLATDPPAAESGWIGGDEAPPAAALDGYRFTSNRLAITGRFREGAVVRTPLLEPARWRPEPRAAVRDRLTLDTVFLGLRMNAFEGELRLRYEPPGLGMGIALALAASAALIALALPRRRAARGAAPRDRSSRPAARRSR